MSLLTGKIIVGDLLSGKRRRMEKRLGVATLAPTLDKRGGGGGPDELRRERLGCRTVRESPGSDETELPEELGSVLAIWRDPDGAA
jgi:hypothetical protein